MMTGILLKQSGKHKDKFSFGLFWKDDQKLEVSPAVVIVTSGLSCFDTAMICDWLKNLVTFLIESEVKPKACVTWS